ncbi:MAG: hypothetical protein CMJ75_02315 [Planctomycetaceae bacterium]|nr:hypothetical protein [Planctomycetaceae bacterium]
MQSIQGLIALAVYGGKLRRSLAYVDREKLESHGMSLMDVQRALMEQNVLIPAGSIKVGQQELQSSPTPMWTKSNNSTTAPSRSIRGKQC